MKALLLFPLIFLADFVIANESKSWSVIDPESYPYVADVIAFAPFKRWIGSVFHQCTGILLSRSVVLTSGHCLRNYSHTVEFKKLTHGGERTAVDETVLANDRVFHRESDLGTDLNLSSDSEGAGYVDIGLMVLERPLPICDDREGRVYAIADLPIVDKQANVWQPKAGKLHNCAIVGFGQYEDQTRGELRQLKDVRINDSGNALVSHLNVNPPICNGDAGAPLVCQSEDNMYNVVGMASFSKGERIHLNVEGEPKCFHNHVNYDTDVFVDLREVLSVIKEGLVELGKLEEFQEDNEKCFKIQLTH